MKKLVMGLLAALLLLGVACAEETLDGYWEEGYHYYLEIDDDFLTLRDYGRRIVLETEFETETDEDGSLVILPADRSLAYREDMREYATILDLRVKDGEMTLKTHWTVLDSDEEYTLTKIEKGPFDYLLLLDDEMLQELEGEWWEEQYEWTIRIEGNHLTMVMDGYEQYPLIDEDIHVVSYDWDEKLVNIVSQDLTKTDFGIVTFFEVEEEELTSIMIVYDVEKTIYLHFKRVECDTPDPNVRMEDIVAYKPVIYLYPEAETEVDVHLTLNGELLCTYPAYGEGWHVTARQDGTLTDERGMRYNYLYWEGDLVTEYDLSKGFCVAGEETAAFLEEALEALGLTRKEANEFIVYWLPQMQQQPYNLIAFQTEAYEQAAKLEVSPTPETVIRVFMTWKPLDEAIRVEPQTLTAPDRTGFTVVEWGGTLVR